MKIALISVTPPYRGGISLNSAILYQYLKPSHDVTVYNFTRQYPDFLFPGKTQYETGTSAVRIPMIRMVDSINPLTWVKTAKAIIRQSPDLLLIRFWHPFFAPLSGFIAGYILKRVPQIHIMAICDNILPHESHWFDTLLVRYFFKKVRSFIVMSSSVESDLKTMVSVPKYRKIFHPVYHVFGDPVPMAEARKTLNIAARKVILYFGYVRAYKGLDTLIEATGILKTKMTDFQVIAVGESYESVEKYQILIQKFEIDDVFRWENQYIPDDQVKLYFSAADVVALPYHSATQSGIIPIAYHFNKPVVATRVGGLPEVVIEGKTGFITTPGDSLELARVLSVGFMEGSFASMAPNIQEEKKRFSWKNMVTAVESLCAEK